MMLECAVHPAFSGPQSPITPGCRTMRAEAAQLPSARRQLRAFHMPGAAALHAPARLMDGLRVRVLQPDHSGHGSWHEQLALRLVRQLHQPDRCADSRINAGVPLPPHFLSPHFQLAIQPSHPAPPDP